MSLIKKLTDIANSEKGKELQEKAKKIANDPQNRQKIEAVKQKFNEKRGGGPAKTGDASDGGAAQTGGAPGGPTTGSADAPAGATGPAPGADPGTPPAGTAGGDDRAA
jgi:hypothetical protein